MPGEEEERTVARHGGGKEGEREARMIENKRKVKIMRRRARMKKRRIERGRKEERKKTKGDQMK